MSTPAAPDTAPPPVENAATKSEEPAIGADEENEAADEAGTRELAGRALATLFIGFEIILGILIAYLVYLTVFGTPLTIGSGEGALTLNLFHLVPMVLVLSWLGLLMGYFAWGTYFYNFNFGRSTRFWKNFVARAKRARREGKTEDDVYREMAAPRKNPYADQTFGLPPGTVRGSLALTIIIGGLALVISFVGGDAFYAPAEDSIVYDYFEFFKTAFLMVVAFYFGTKGLDILERERTLRFNAQVKAQSAARESTGIEDLRRELEGDTVVDEKTNGQPEPSDDGDIRRIADAAPTMTRTVEDARGDLLEKHYPQIADLEVEEREVREIQPRDLELAAEDAELELPLVQAVKDVEARGKGFLPSGRPKILFEGHIFWRQLEKYDIDPKPLADKHPGILYQRWTRTHYKGGEAEHDRLNEARAIHDSAALCSASWGTFQVMGFNHKTCGFDTVQDFVAAHERSEKEHLRAFLKFLENTRTSDGKTLIEQLRAHEWASFARGYNGPGYKQNKYDEKLKQAYERYSSA